MGIFGPSKKEIWRQLANEIDANVVDAGFLKGEKIIAKHNNWRICLDTYTVSTGKSSVTYTRIRSPFINNNNFYFKIYRKGIFSDLGKIFGMQDIEIGHEAFDYEFIIKGNNEEKVKQLFSNDTIRDLICRQPKICLEIKKNEGFWGPKFKENENELIFLVVGVIKDIERLKSLFDLFAETLDELKAIGVSDGKDADVII